jgi:hypothetical protein
MKRFWRFSIAISVRKKNSENGHIFIFGFQCLAKDMKG